MDLAEPKALPHSEESERAVLAAALIDHERYLPIAAARLAIDDFYFERHQRLYSSMLELQAAGVEIDLRTLQAKLEQRKQLELVGGVAYLATLDVDLPDLGRVDVYVEIIKERSLRRRLIYACAEIHRDCLDGGLEARAALDRAEQKIFQLGEEAVARGFLTIQDALGRALEELELRSEGELPGVDTPYQDLNRMSYGFHPGHLIVIAGRPGMGKTSFALNVAQWVAIRQRIGVAVFSLEMSQHELAMRVLSSEAMIDFARLRRGNLSDREWSTIMDVRGRIGEAPLYLDDAANPTLLEISSKVRRLQNEKGVGLVIIDYLQLMSSGARYENRTLEISAITRGLKQLAKELQVPVIALSQLSRQPERRGADHRPQLADLRESGSIEQDADLVAFVYRDVVYHPDDADENEAELILAKNRHGETGVVRLFFDGTITTFRDVERHDSPPPDLDLEDAR
ncbi:MAG TPA: replicative DNA helicase [Thermoanaerobaculia bacterium]|nr:replicative DNA helicase [Thermoanaerobaculia bacterium]